MPPPSYSELLPEMMTFSIRPSFLPDFWSTWMPPPLWSRLDVVFPDSNEVFFEIDAVGVLSVEVILK